MPRALLWIPRALEGGETGRSIVAVAQGAPGGCHDRLQYQCRDQTPELQPCYTAVFVDVKSTEHSVELI